MPTFQLVFFRAFASVLCCVIVLKRLRLNPVGNRPRWLILRALAGLISMSLYFKAIHMMPVGTAVTLRYISPFFAAGLAVIFLKERMLGIQWLFLLIAFAGVAMLKGFDPRISTDGLIVILSSAVFSGLVYMIIRFIGHGEHPVVVVNYFMSLSLIVSAVVCLFYWRMPYGIEWLILFSMGLFGYFAQYFMTKAMQNEESNQIVPFKYIEVILTMLVAWFLFAEYQSLQSVFAIFIIIFALILNVKIKSWIKNPKNK